MPPRIDPEGPAQRLQLVAPPSWVAKVDEWRARQGAFPPNRSEAIRHLVDLALAAEAGGKLDWWNEPATKKVKR